METGLWNGNTVYYHLFYWLLSLQFVFFFSPFQTHDSLTFLARHILTIGSQLPVYGTFGITPLASIRIGRVQSHTTATSLAINLGGGRGAKGGLRPSGPQDPPQLLRWHPQWGSTFALTVNSLWNSPLQLRSMTRPVMVGVYKRLNVCLSFRIKTNKND